MSFMIQKPTIQMIGPDDMRWVDPIYDFYASERKSLENPNWLLDRTAHDFHALIGGKNGGRIWVATTPNDVGGGVYIRGIIAFEMGSLTMGHIPEPRDPIKNFLANPALRTSFGDASRKSKVGVIGCLLTDESHRNNGLALRLVKKAINYAMDEAKTLHIGALVVQGNEAALEIFRKAGFVILGQDQRPDGTPRYAMGVKAELPSLACVA